MIRFVIRCVGGGVLFVAFFGLAIGTNATFVVPTLFAAGMLLIGVSLDKHGD